MSSLWGVPDTWATTPGAKPELDNLFLGAQIQHERALTQKEMLDARKTAMELQADEAVARKFQSMAQGQGGDSGQAADPVSQIMEIGNAYISAGAPNKGIGIVNKATEIQQHINAAKLSQARTQNLDFERQEKAIGDLIELTTDVKGPEDWAIRQMMWAQKHPGQQLPPALRGYNPDIIKSVADTSKRSLENAKLQRQQAMDEERKRHDKRMEEQAATREAHREAQRKITNAWRESRDRDRKAGGGKVDRASSTEVQQAKTLAMKEFPDLEADETNLIDVGSGKGAFKASTFAVDLAEQAKAIQATNKGLSYPEALQKAFDVAKESGAVTKTTAEKSPIKIGSFEVPGTGKTTTKSTYSGAASGTPSSPLPARPGMAMRDGGWYTFNGKTGQYDAKTGGMKNVRAATISSGGDGADEEGDDDADE